jgi:protein-L-isoaspartate O-methyltransferase
MFVWLVMHDYNDRIYGIYATEELAEEAKREIQETGYYLVTVEKMPVMSEPREGA